MDEIERPYNVHMLEECIDMLLQYGFRCVRTSVPTSFSIIWVNTSRRMTYLLSVCCALGLSSVWTLASSLGSD